MRPALWTIFSTEMVKNPSIFVTYFSSSFHFLHCHAGLLWLHFYKNYSCFNDANKMLLISKSIFFTPCFSNFLWFTIYFSRYLQFPLNTIMFQKIYITERLLLKIMELENGSFSSEIFCKKSCYSFKMLTNCYIILQLWTSSVTKHIKRPTIFMTYSQSSCQITVTYAQGSRYLQTASGQKWCHFSGF